LSRQLVGLATGELRTHHSPLRGIEAVGREAHRNHRVVLGVLGGPLGVLLLHLGLPLDEVSLNGARGFRPPTQSWTVRWPTQAPRGVTAAQRGSFPARPPPSPRLV